MKVALDLVCFLRLYHSLKTDQSDVLIRLKHSLLLLLFGPLNYCVMLAILDRGTDHLVIELIRVPLSRLLAQLLYMVVTHDVCIY